MRRRHRLLDAYVRVELEERGVLSDDRPDRCHPEPLHPRPEAAEQDPNDGEDAREDRPA
jgi:hypothetical protein